MSIPELTYDMNIISRVDDEPNDVGGLSAAQLKAKFDEGCLAIKNYLNEALIPSLTSESCAANLGMIDPNSQEQSSVQTVVDHLARDLNDALIAAGVLPLGGTEGQLLQKASGDNYDTKWGGVLESQLPFHLAKAKQLSAATAAMYGKGASAVPNDIFAYLGKYAQHWWRRIGAVPATYRLDSEVTDRVCMGGYVCTLYYSDSLDIAADGTLSLANPVSSFEIVGRNQNDELSNLDTIKEKFFYKDGGLNSTGISVDAIYYRTSTVDAYIGNDGSYVSAQPVYGIPATVAGEAAYIHSADRNAYPDSGTVDELTYEYLGIPFQNAVTAPKFETCSYVGTGYAGEDHKNTLTFGIKPMLIFIQCSEGGTGNCVMVRGGSFICEDDGNSGGTGVLAWDERTITWYATTGHYGNYSSSVDSDMGKYQMNIANAIYTVLAVGY